MKKIIGEGLPLWKFDHLIEHDHEMAHFVTSREGGHGQGPTGSFNLGFVNWGDPEEVFQNRLLLAQRLGIPVPQLVFPRQCHGNRAVVIDGSFPIGDSPSRLASTDALVTDVPGICLCVLTADCVPVLFYDQKKKAIGVAHAGWKGTVKKIVIETLGLMKYLYGSSEKDMLVGIGPSIGPEVYEVGNAVMEPWLGCWPNALGLGLAKQKPNGKFLVNLWETNRFMLEQAGVPPENIEVSGICTFTEASTFYSARASNHKCGRFATGIFL